MYKSNSHKNIILLKRNQQLRSNKQSLQLKLSEQKQESTKFILYNNGLALDSKSPKRTIIPKYNIINLYNNINSNINCDKTIINLLGNTNGFGDFLRGSILLAQYAKYYNINFKVDMSRHIISKYLDNISEVLPVIKKINEFNYDNRDKNDDLHLIIKQFINSNEKNLYIETNLFYNIDLVSDDIKNYINSTIKFKQIYYDKVNELFNLKKYNVLHIRCTDDNFNTDFEDNNLLTEIIKLQLSSNTIVLSNNYKLKQKINKLFGFYFIDAKSLHTASTNINYTDLESTIIEYIILSNSSNTYCFSYYGHGSGFSEQCSILNNIPYSVVILDNNNIQFQNIVYFKKHQLQNINYKTSTVNHRLLQKHRLFL